MPIIHSQLCRTSDVMAKSLTTFNTIQICKIESIRCSKLLNMAKTHYHLQIKNIKLHIVTDIKVRLNISLLFRFDDAYNLQPAVNQMQILQQYCDDNRWMPILQVCYQNLYYRDLCDPVMPHIQMQQSRPQPEV